MSAPDRPTRVNRKAVLDDGLLSRRSLDMEAEAQAALMQSNDFKRAYEAFAAKRTPEFRGD